MTLYMRLCLRPNAKTGLLQIATKKANDIARLANLLGEPLELLQKRTGDCARP